MTRSIRALIILPFVVLALSGCATQLEKAIDAGDISAARIAIEQGADVSSSYFLSPVHEAVHKKNLPIIQLLHANGAQLNQCYLDTDFPNFWNVNQSSYFHDSLPPLGSAIARNDVAIVSGLLELGAPIEQTCLIPMWPDYDFSAIMVAAEFGSAPIVNLLLDNGAMPNRLLNGHTPLSIAAYRGHYETVRILLARGGYHSYSNDIKQPIEHASDAGNEDIVNLLVHAGALRPRRSDPSKVFENIADALVDGVIVIGTIALLAEGSKYYGYQDGYTPNYFSSNGGTSPAQSQIQSAYTSDDNQCNSDIQCTVQQICLKKPGHISGICVRDASHSRLRGERDSVSSGFTRPLEPNRTSDCKDGGHWDLIYQACVE